MPYSQKDDGWWTDLTLSKLSDRAYRLHDNCWSYGADKLTDGRLAREEVARVAAMFGVTDSQCLADTVKEIVMAGVWIQDVEGYVMVGWLDSNRSRERVERDRASNRERQARFGKKGGRKQR
jgi:hypothetical protein